MEQDEASGLRMEVSEHIDFMDSCCHGTVSSWNFGYQSRNSLFNDLNYFHQFAFGV